MYLIFFLCSCKNYNNVNIDIYEDVLEVEFKSSYGFVIMNDKELLFYAIDFKVMKKYFNQNVSSEKMMLDIKSTKWVSNLGGCRFEKFAFLNWFNDFSSKEILMKYCFEQIKCKIIPVYIIELPYTSNLKYSKIKPCEGNVPQLPFEVYSRPKLNVVYIEPINSFEANQFLNFKDTVDRNSYLNYIKFNCH